MSFDANVPASGQSLGSSRQPIKTNMAVLRSSFATNHVDPNNANPGKHNLSAYLLQANSPATIAGEMAAYSRTANGEPQLYYQRQNKAASANDDIQATRLDKGATASLNGFSFLPGGILLQWGQATFAGAALSVAVTFPTAFSSNPEVFNVQATLIGFANACTAQNYVTTGCSINRSAGGGTNQTVSWVAIGK